MTEKRFWLVSLEYDGEHRFVRDNNQIGEKSLSNQEVVDLLNEQHEQIQEQKRQIKGFILMKNGLIDDCMKLSEENEQLKKRLDDRIKYTHQLEVELRKKGDVE